MYERELPDKFLHRDVLQLEAADLQAYFVVGYGAIDNVVVMRLNVGLVAAVHNDEFRPFLRIALEDFHFQVQRLIEDAVIKLIGGQYRLTHFFTVNCPFCHLLCLLAVWAEIESLPEVLAATPAFQVNLVDACV